MKIEYDLEDINDVIKLDSGCQPIFRTLNRITSYHYIDVQCAQISSRSSRDGLSGFCLVSDSLLLILPHVLWGIVILRYKV